MDDCLGSGRASSATRSCAAVSFTMGGAGSGMAYDEADLRRIAGAGLPPARPPRCSSRSRSSAGRSTSSRSCATRTDNVVIVCSIENLDPMGVHTGDSITVAPAMTLTDREYQRLRDIAIGVIRAVGVDTGGCNIQFAVNPADGRLVVIEMNPRVSPLAARWPPRRPASRSPRSRPRSRSATPSTRSPTTSPAKTPGQLRADARLRRGEGAAVRVREVPRRRPDADHAHEVGRRGDGDRPQLHRGAAEGAPLAGEHGRAVRLAPRAGRARQGELLEQTRAAARRPAQAGAWTRSAPGPRPRRSSTRPASTRGSSTSCC